MLTLDGGIGQDTIYANGADETTGGADDDQIFGDEAPELGSDAAAPLEAALMPFVEKFGVEAVENAVGQVGAAQASVASDARSETALASYSLLTASPPIKGDYRPDNLWGSSGNDTIYGYGGDDRLFGNIGDDILWGGNDNDLLSGGQGGRLS